MPAELRLLVNGEPRQVPLATTVDGLITLVGIERRGVAVAVDGQVVPRSAWCSSSLADGAHVEIVSARPGG
jgi:sulfur carrier protein